MRVTAAIHHAIRHSTPDRPANHPGPGGSANQLRPVAAWNGSSGFDPPRPAQDPSSPPRLPILHQIQRTIDRALATGNPALSWVNQMDAPPLAVNNNCGFAAGLAALRYLGAEAPPGATTYDQVMELRRRGTGGRNPAVLASNPAIVMSLNASGVQATKIPLQDGWDRDKSLPVQWMRDQMLDTSNGLEVFILGGNPSAGGAWGDMGAEDGNHWVTVVSYDQASDTFTVLDSDLDEGFTGPIQVSSQQLASYLEGGIVYDEMIEVRP